MANSGGEGERGAQARRRGESALRLAQAELAAKIEELRAAEASARRTREALSVRVDQLEAERALTLHLARTDSLTGLLNRGAFTSALIERLEQAQAAGERVALYIFDLDRFKHLNDSLGHHAGDLLLNEIGARLKTQARPGDQVARLGGDEFALIAQGGDEADRAEALTAALATPYSIYGRTVAPGASVGVAVYPDAAVDATDLQRFADMALYRAKASAGRRWSVFDAEMRDASEKRHGLESDLRRAIALGEIVPWYQPVVEARDGRIVGLEVLARWMHPEQGMLPPAEFVPLAEEIGLISQMDAAVFAAACQRAAPWVAEGLIEFIACNVSPRELLDPSFSRSLIRRLRATDLPATALKVEITETFLVQDLALARRHIERLASVGIRVALDDFGTGYSNLRALLKLPISTVKLDQSLIGDVGKDPRVSKLVRSMLQAVTALDAEIVAEGVEDEAQALFLRAAGCDRMQGFLFARPMPADEVELRLRQGVAKTGPLPFAAVPAVARG
ncbi:MAG TPA: EAL domain-containing protein [Phenylobacterium sp.]|nr:EAL domain-containing protein [Phenylobacterium sp.]